MDALTVMLATYNGAATIGTTLQALCEVDVPTASWRVVVIDNGSTDGTTAIARSFEAKLPLVLLHEPRRGKNNAINAGLPHAIGDLVVFTDDDTIPRADWLTNYVAAAAANPEADVLGGAVKVRWPRPPETWVLEWVHQGIVYALLDNLPEGPILPSSIVGGNFAVRASVFDQGFAFDPAFGPDGGPSYMMGSETEFAARLHDAGRLCWHVPDAIVEHIVRPNQMERDWILRRAFRFGRTRGNRGYRHDDSVSLFGVPRYAFRLLVEHYVRITWALVSRNAELEFKTLWKINELKGVIYEHWRLRRDRALTRHR
jgi:L-malate glycosyltransferase